MMTFNVWVQVRAAVSSYLQLPAGAAQDQAEPTEPVLPGQARLGPLQVSEGRPLGGHSSRGQADGENWYLQPLLR